ncbi:MAG: response regulator [Lachnospiraceae bacterium]|nr:response regulator [Lachnospiraceae bacterium]
MNYIMEYDYAAIGIMLFTLFFLFTRNDLKRTENRILAVLCFMNLFSIFADITAYNVQSQENIARWGTGPGTFWNTFYLVLHTQMTLVLILYIVGILGIRKRIKKIQWAVMLAPSVAVLFVLALNPFLGWYFYYNEQNIYSYGPMSIVIFGGPALQIMIVMFLTVRFRKALQKNMMLAIGLFIVLTLSAIAIQHQWRELLVELFVQSLGLLGVMLATENRDEIRSMVEAMEELEKARAHAEEASRSKSDFLANMSHEIRTPINAVLGMNEMVMRESMQAEREMPATREGVQKAFGNITVYAGDIRSAGQNLLSIINDILDFSKIESGRMELVDEPYQLSSVLNDVSNMIMFRARGKDLAFTVDVDETLPDGFIGDEVRVRQILTNILSNAVKYTDEGSVSLSVRGDAATKRGMTNRLVFTVKDTGIGIREEDRKKLFAKFQRVDLTRNNTIEGTGLGLAITQSLLQMMKGQIELESTYGVGSTFTVTIPQKVIDPTPIGNFREKFEQGIREKTVYRELFRAPEARILVVDDTAVNLTVIKGLLSETKVKVNTATGGAQALEMTKDIPFDVILMDQRMPEIDGTETLERIRDQEGGVNLSTPVICLTADAVQGARDRYLKEGFSDYLSKPVDGPQLEAMLKTYLPPEKVEEVERSVRYGDASAETGAAQGDASSRPASGSGNQNGSETEEPSPLFHAVTPDEAKEIIARETPALLAEYRALQAVLAHMPGIADENGTGGAAADADRPEIDPDELRELYDGVLEFAESYDIDSIDRLLQQMKAYRIPESERERFAHLTRIVRASDWDALGRLLQ